MGSFGSTGILHHDLRVAIRSFRRRPLLYGVAAFSLALGIAANASMFSVMDAVLFRPLPYSEPDRLVRVWSSITRYPGSRLMPSHPDLLDYRERARTIEVAGHATGSVNLLAGDRARRVDGRTVSWNLFDVLGVSPALGRSFLPEDEAEGAPPVLILSDGLFRELGADSSLVGSTITVDGTPRTVVGILPRGFRLVGIRVSVFLPGQRGAWRRDNHVWYSMGRLRRGATLDQAESELEGLAAGLAEAHPETDRDLTVLLQPLRQSFVNPTGWAAAGILAVAVALVLLIACVNIANLLLALAAGRAREIAIRSAVGAGRWRVARQLFVESLLLAVAGGTVGLLLAQVGLSWLRTILPDNVPQMGQIAIDLRVLVFTAGATILSAVLFGVAPALQAARTDLRAVLAGGGRSGDARHRTVARNGLVVAQVALALVLLASAGLMIRGMLLVRHADLGYDTGSALTLRTTLSYADYPTEGAVVTHFEQAIERLRALPGVTAVGAAQVLPFDYAWQFPYHPADAPPEPGARAPSARYYMATPGYLDALGMTLLRGRWIEPSDRLDRAPVAVISQALAEREWPGGDPIGRRIVIQDREREVVGVVGDTRMVGPIERARATIFVPAAQVPQRTMGVVLRTAGRPEALAIPARERLAALDPHQPVYDIMTLRDRVAAGTEEESVLTRLLAIFAALALMLALVGVYGVIAYSVSQRRRELGVRAALGADRAALVRLVVRGGAALALAGAGIGIVLALGAGVALSSFTFGVSAFDPIVHFSVAITIAATAVAASWLPAHRAAKVDPLEALRVE